MKTVLISFCFIFAIFFTSCSSRKYQDSEVVISDIQAEKQAIAVFKVRGKQPPLSFGNGPKVSFDLAKIEPITSKAPISKIFYRVKPGYFSKLNPWSNQWTILMVQPGFYVIDNISWTSGNTTYSSPKDVLPSSSPVKFGAFEVKAGTVNYIGNLEFSSKGGVLNIVYTDQFSEAKESLSKTHPELADRLVRTEFLPGGYYYLQPHLFSKEQLEGSEVKDDELLPESM